MAMGHWMRCVGAIAAGWLALVGRLTAADSPKLFGQNPRTAQRFVEAAALEKQQRWNEAVELYLRLTDESGDDLVPADGGATQLLPARSLVQRRVAARPELLGPYRARVEARANRLLQQGEAGHEPALLEQIVDQFFCSRSTDAALHLLGDLACERGDFELARRYWHMLEPADSPRALGYPDPQGGPALARAKQILARLLAGERAHALSELHAFRTAFPDAAGHLAGRDGNFVATLQSLCDAGESLRALAPAGIAPAPNTFGGDATRNDLLHGVLPPFSPQPRYPPIPLPGAMVDRTIQRPPVGPSALAFYPLIARGQVFVADARSVLAYDLATGHLSGRYVLPGGRSAAADGALPLAAGGCFTLSIDGDRVYARLGPAKMRSPRGEAVSKLVCLQWRPEQPAPDDRLHMMWTLAAAKADANDAAAWEGTPAIRDGKLFAAITRVDGTRAVSTIVCYPAADPSAGPLWQKDVYEAAAETADRSRPHLLTVAGPHVVLSSDAGVVIALEAATGRRAWAFRYQSTSRPWATGGPDDANPAIFAKGKVFIAPADSDRVWCLNADTGAPEWSSKPIPVAHLLGLAQGRVVCLLGGVHAGLCALDAATGHVLSDWGYRVAGADAMGPFGRGILCNDRVYWPTRAAGVNEMGWDGTPSYPPTCFRDLPGGNIAYGEGCLVVATADHLHVLVGASAASGTPDDRVGHGPGQRHDLLLWRAELLRHTGAPAAEIRSVLDAAAAPEFSPDRRYLALVRRSEYELTQGDRALALAAAKTVVDSAELSHVVVRDAGGAIHSARNWAAEQIGRREAPAVSYLSHDHHLDQEADAPRSQVQVRLPLEPTWRLPIDQGHEWALLPGRDPDPARVFVAGRHWLACREASDGRERWRADLPFNPAWLRVANGSLIVGGDNGIARLIAADGQSKWTFPLPDVAPWFDRPGWHDLNNARPRDRFSGFRWVGDRVVVRLGSRFLLSLEGETGRILWQRSAPIGCQFYPEFFADSRCVVAQSSDGCRWILDAESGRTLLTDPASKVAWPSPPLVLDARRMLIVEDGRLVALDRSNWKPAWTWDLPRATSLSGELPRTRLVNDVLLVGVTRNDCYEIERLNPNTGRPLAGEAVAIGRRPVDLASLTVEGNLLHVAVEEQLKSIDLRSGGIIARRALQPVGFWRIELAANGLICWMLPTASPNEPASRSGLLTIIDPSALERQRGSQDCSLGIGLGPADVLRAVCVGKDRVVVVTDSEVRGYRGATREAK